MCEKSLQKRRILIVDDNTAIHEDFKQILSPQKCINITEMVQLEKELFDNTVEMTIPVNEGIYEIDDAYSGEEAFELVEKAECDNRQYLVIFMDVRMPPGMDGIDTIQKIWKSYPDIEMVICTAFSDYSWPEILQRFGTTDKLLFVRKPFDTVTIKQLALALSTKAKLEIQNRKVTESLEKTVSVRTAELKAMVEDMTRLSSRYRSLFEQAPLGIITVNCNGIIKQINPAAADMFKITQRQKCINIFNDKPFSDISDIIKSVCRPEKVFTTECKCNLPDGEEKVLKIRSASIQNEEINIGYMLIIEDYTECKQLQKKLIHSEKMNSIGQLAGGIAHDFNNLLTIISGNIQMIKQRNAFNDYLDLTGIEQIEKALNRASDLVSKMLAFSRKGKYQSVPVSIHSIIADVTNLLEHSVDKRINICTELGENNPYVLGDPVQLQNIILNIALNARDAIQQNGTMSFRTEIATFDNDYVIDKSVRMNTDYVIIRISDNGIGMNDDILSHIYEPFFTTKKNGSGMGLASVYGAVKTHNGIIKCDSTPGSGTTFYLYFPVINHKSSNEEPKCESPVLNEQKKTNKIMVVDDEILVLEITQKFCNELGYATIGCNTGKEAIDIYRNSCMEIDLVILDVIMPQLSGYDIFKQMKQIKPSLKVVVVSGFSDHDEITLMLNEGASAFLQKPYSIKELDTIIKKCLS